MSRSIFFVCGQACKGFDEARFQINAIGDVESWTEWRIHLEWKTGCPGLACNMQLCQFLHIR